MSPEIEESVKKIQACFGKDSDFIKREVAIDGGLKVYIIYLDTLINKTILGTNIIQPVLQLKKEDLEAREEESVSDFLVKRIITSGRAVAKVKMRSVIHEILEGGVVLIIDGEKEFVSCNIPGYEKRPITEPPTSAVLKGPREGFTEDILTNVGLIRKRLRCTDLVVKTRKIGKETGTSVSVVYLKNIASQEVIKELDRRLNKINIDGIIDSFYIQTMLENKHNSFFKQVGNSEKPDVVTARLLEGRVAIICDGSPMVLTIPFVLIEDLQSGEDYYTQPIRASFVRLLRILGLFFAVVLPGIYVATQSYHYEILPLNFLVSLLSSIGQLSFPPIIEMFFVLFLFEILNEASLRMPKYLGMALSVIGALVLGDTAVQAGIVSPPAVMVVAVSGIAIYTIPDQVGAISLLRIIFTFLGGVSGFYGIMLGGVFLCTYLATLTNFSTPMLAPYAPTIPSDKKDAILKKDLKSMIKRPKSIPNINETRMKNG